MPPLGKRRNPLIPVLPDRASKKSAIGNRQSKMSLAERTVEDVLLHFGDSVKIAHREYREFVEKGIDQGRRPELQDGGLVRPACHAREGHLLSEIVE